MVKVRIPNRKISHKVAKRNKRKLSIRKKIRGITEKPRLSVFRSNKHFSAQVIDDSKGVTIASVSSYEKELKINKNVTIETVKKLGEVLAVRLKEQKTNSVVFDRNGYKYHGLVKSFADGVRSKIKF